MGDIKLPLKQDNYTVFSRYVKNSKLSKGDVIL